MRPRRGGPPPREATRTRHVGITWRRCRWPPIAACGHRRNAYWFRLRHIRQNRNTARRRGRLRFRDHEHMPARVTLDSLAERSRLKFEIVGTLWTFIGYSPVGSLVKVDRTGTAGDATPRPRRSRAMCRQKARGSRKHGTRRCRLRCQRG